MVPAVVQPASEQRASVPAAAEERPGLDPPFSVLVALFVVSGAAGLVDQLCFSKYLGYIVGSTAYAVSAVLAAFMTGIALGAFLGGRWSGRMRHPLMAYGVLEIAAGISVVLTPLAFGALTPLYAALAAHLPGSLAGLSLLRWLLALLIVIVPTTAMGATLPVLSRGIELARDGRVRERRLGLLYAANTLGGAAGALLSAYLLVPALGLSGTLLGSALASAGVGAVAIGLGRKRAMRRGRVTPTSVEPAPVSRALPARRARGLLLGLAFASGYLVFACEVVFTHLLALVIGNSAYAFGLILAAFLIWLFSGASLSMVAHRRLGSAALPLGLAATAIGLTATLPLWDDLPRLFVISGLQFDSFLAREAIRALVAILILMLPTVAMGLTFPLLLQRAAAYENVGLWVGRLTAVNTLGAVSGALLTGYLVLPALGSQKALLAVAVVFALLAPLTLRTERPPVRRVCLLAAGASLLLAALSPAWDAVALTSGNNVYFEGQKTRAHVVSFAEDVHGGVTTVTRANGVFTLYTNGKFQGNTGWEMRAQRFFAHYPSIFVQRFDSALVIGLGTGTTLGTLAAYPWQRIQVVEISPAIVAAARRYFGKPNRDALDDPRVSVTLADGRNHLLVDSARYDLIGIELSSIWFSGAANLYSHDFYELVRSRLAPGGVFQQWVQLHHIHRRDFASILYTLRQSFSHVALFYGGGQGILVASAQPLRASAARLRRLSKDPELSALIPFGRDLPSLIDDVLVVDRGLDAFLAESARAAGEPVEALLSTDDNVYLEYATPRGNVLPWRTRDQLVAELSRFTDEGAIASLLSPR